MSFWSLVESAASDHPGRVLFRDDYGRSLTALQFRDQAEMVAAALGVEPGRPVSWQLPTVLEAPVLMAALARLGAVQSPIITILRERELSLIKERHRPELFVVPTTWRGFDHGRAARELGGPSVLALDLEDEPGDALRLPVGDPATLPPPPTDAGAHRWTYFSSGTTAEPKGVRHSDRSVIAGSNGMVDYLGVRDGDVYPMAWPYPHIGGVAMTSTVLRAGGTLVLFDRFDQDTPARMAAHRPTLLGSATPFFRAYLAAERTHPGLFSQVRMFCAGGAPTPPEVVHELVEVFGVPGLQDAWGLTEFPIATSSRFGDSPANLEGNVGRPCPGVSVQVVEGELRLKGPQSFIGYLDPSLDGEAFDADGWFRTGDLGHVDDEGYVNISGRLKDVIIRNAENISASEVEIALASHPGVDDVAVVGIPDAGTGERVCAFIVGRADLTLADLGAHCTAAGLARQKIPERIELLPVLPRNGMGKVLKQELRASLGVD